MDMTVSFARHFRGIKMSKLRCFARVVACATVSGLLAAPFAAQAAGYPERPITMIVPFGAGGITDIVARATGKALSEQLGQPVVIENRPGAGGNIAAGALKRAKPDGYTLMFTTMGLVAVNPHTGETGFDSFKDFTYVSTVAKTPHVIAVQAGLPVKDLKSLIDLASKAPESISFGTAGVGSSPYQGMEIMQAEQGVKFLHVPFKSGAESVTNVVSGQVDMTFEATPQVLPFVASGRMRGLALAHTERIASAPDLPSTAELGYPGLVSNSIAGVVGPAGLAPDVVSTLNSAIRKALADPAFKDSLLKQGTATSPSTPEDFKAQVDLEFKRWAAIIGKSAVAAK